MPDENAFEAAKMIEDMLLRLKHDDMVLTLISGFYFEFPHICTFVLYNEITSYANWEGGM